MKPVDGAYLRLERELAEKDFRITPQRRIILNVLSSQQNRHLTAEQIYRIARAQGIATLFALDAVGYWRFPGQ